MASSLSSLTQPMATIQVWLAKGGKGQATWLLCMPSELAWVVKAFKPQPLNNLGPALSETFQWAELKLLSFIQLLVWIMSSKSDAGQHSGQENGFWNILWLVLACGLKHINLPLPLFSHLQNGLNNRSIHSSSETEKPAMTYKSHFNCLHMKSTHAQYYVTCLSIVSEVKTYE